ncbi:MAG: metallophosphoesterase family protein [Victivallales bacterium]|nr:metallophosphoesterase family protein [Victivallales bacterium]
MTRIAFISDIHSNYEALTAILSRLDREGYDMLLCLGDIVGYGASPNECVSLVREREIPCVLGNHDEYATLLMDPSIGRLREDVQHSIGWTQENLSMDAIKWLAMLPERLEVENEFIALHSSFAARWGYCRNEETFEANFKRQPCRLAFCGHSHTPLIGVDVPGHQPFVDFIHDTPIPQSGKVMVNVGSVGQPRDHNPYACACIYELESGVVSIVRERYDIETSQAKIRAAGLPERFALRLGVGR